ncbi:enoyl-CoA hydratase-related protein [Shimia sp. SDUM112013]|uniref:enoyl-CoA hydratase-related protein n=1 Tax=Shimia sp. SDUM112013 TaxID=3136160 RepID=UPI0032EF7B3A
MNSMDDTPLVAERHEDGVMWLTLGAGRAHALSMGVLQALDTGLARAEQDPDVRVIVLHGPGHIFCAGHDLKEIARHRQDPDLGAAYLQNLFALCAQVMTRLTLGPKPTVAMVDGIATAAGLQMVAACDLAFASTRASFCLPGVQNGGFCSTPAVAVGRVISRKHAMEMAMTGDSYSADWALAAGLVNRVLPPEALEQVVRDRVRTLATRHLPAVSLGKQTFYQQLEQPLAEAYQTASDAMLTHFMDPERIALERKTWS